MIKCDILSNIFEIVFKQKTYQKRLGMNNCGDDCIYL